MSNTKHYPTHPGAEHPPIMTCEIPLEEYESIKKQNAKLRADNERLTRAIDVYQGSISVHKCKCAELSMKLCEKRNENKRLKRALWLARAKRAIEKIAWFRLWNANISTMNPEDGARQEYDKWKKALGKFLKKAEEYK